MNKRLQWIYDHVPIHLQNGLITIYNLKQNRRRYAGNYKSIKEYFKKWRYKSLDKIQDEQNNRLTSFLQYSQYNSEFYKSILPPKRFFNLEDLAKLPIVTKQDLIQNYDQLKTISESKGNISYTGGTTGASLKVVYRWEDVQERRAFLDYFWEQYGYQRGVKTAWFSGKHIVPSTKSTKLWRTDWINNIRYYSTFHITKDKIKYYLENLNRYQPQYMVGFPSSVYEIAKLATELDIKYEGKVTCFFPTAESLISEQVALIKKYFKCEVRDQYASSEGAPFITECPEGNLHYDMLTGVIEVVDDNLKPSMEGEILVTSFTTRGTPLIRYKIGDRIKFDDKGIICPCGQKTPIVEKIYGRSTDYILSLDRGKVNLGNISNCTKGIKGIIRFQLVQESATNISVLVQVENNFTQTQRTNFKSNLQNTLGPSMTISIVKKDHIPREKSGKFRIVKNKII